VVALRITIEDIPLAQGVGRSRAIVVVSEGGNARPCVLIRTPYPRLGSLTDNAGLQLAEAGFVVVVQSARGRHGSDGRFVAFRDDAPDGAEAIAWCSNQAWCDGRVFVVGKSYEGFAAWAASSIQPRALVGLAVSMTASRPVHWFYENGLFRHSFAQSWGLSLAYTDEQLPVADFPKVRKAALDLDALYSLSPPESPLVDVLPGYSDWLSESVLEELGSGFVSARSVPVHMVSGWNDIFVRGALCDAALMKMPGDRVLIGPWSHDTVGVRIVGQADYGVEATTGEFDVVADRVGWMKDLLNGAAKGGAQLFSLFNRRWIDPAEWSSKSVALNVPLTWDKQTAQCVLACFSAGERVRTPGGRVHHPTLPLAGGFSYPDWKASAHLTFRSGRMSESVQIYGSIQLTIEANGLPEGMLAGWIFVESIDGALRSLTTGARRLLAGTGHCTIDLEFAEVAAALECGSCLVVLVATSSWPEFYSAADLAGTFIVQNPESCYVRLPTKG